MIRFCRKNFYTISIISILLFSIFLRFYHYESRWGLAYDQAHDALVARYALENAKLPLLGPFSSAGAFQTGGEWYWIIMLGTAFYPFSVISPWIFMTMLYVLFVLAIILFAKEFVDKKFALIVGLLTCVSTAQIAQGVSLTNQSPQAIFSLLSIWFAIRFLRTKKRWYLFFLALLVGTAASIHLQGTALIMLVFFTLIFSGIPRISDFIILGLGLVLPWVPVLLADMQNNFYNTKNMINYYLHDQYKISLDVLGRRWLTYAGVLWPKMWSHVIGGNLIVGYVLSISVFLISFYMILKKKLTKEWIVLLLSFAGMIIILRYTRTPIFDSFIVFLHPFIFLFCGWIIYLCFKNYKVVGIAVLLIVIIFSLKKSLEEINYPQSPVAASSKQLREELIKKYPDTQFAVYDFQNKTTGTSYPLVLFLDEKKMNSEKGRRVGISLNKEMTQYTAIDLQKKSNNALNKDGWHLVTPEKVYLSTEEWYKRDTKY